MTTDRKELFSERISAGSRTYFFDIKQSQNGPTYLVISESRQSGPTYEHNRVMVFEENLEAFLIALDKAAKFLAVKVSEQPQPANNAQVSLPLEEPARPPKTDRLEEIRQKYPRAYEKWLPDEDDALKRKFQEGRSPKELAHLFERQPGAIRARLRKLGLLIE